MDDGPRSATPSLPHLIFPSFSCTVDRYTTPLGSAHNLEVAPSAPALFWHVDEGGVVGQHDIREPVASPESCTLFTLISTCTFVCI